MGLTAAWIFASLVVAQPAHDAPESADLRARSRTALERSLKLVERAARAYPARRDCFACHHQTFPLLVQRRARDSGLAIDETTRAATIAFTRRAFESQRETLAAGGRIDGRDITVAYGLWTLEIADQPRDALFAALTLNLLQTQHADGYWEPEAHRPPAEESRLFVTALALRGLRRDDARERAERIRLATERAVRWAEQKQPESLDDQAGLVMLHASHAPGGAAHQAALAALVAQQRPDGGWSQRPEMASDAYAAGLALYTLRDSRFDLASPPYRRGVQYLLDSQLPDGSWRVVSRCDPVQPYFDNGDPHGKDQFLSLMATAWSAAALP